MTALPPIFVNPSNGSDVNNNGTNPLTPLLTFGAVAPLLAALDRTSMAQLMDQTVYLAAGLYTGAGNCHVFVDLDNIVQLRIVGVGAGNQSDAVFVCGSVTFNESEPYIHAFDVISFGMSDVTYADTQIDANAIAAPIGAHTYRTGSAAFGQRAASVLFVRTHDTSFGFAPQIDRLISLVDVTVRNVTLDRSTAFNSPRSANPSQSPLVALAPDLASAPYGPIVVTRFRAESNSVAFSPCVNDDSGSEGSLLNTWAAFSSAALAISGLRVHVNDSTFVHNTANVTGHSREVVSNLTCYFGAAPALLLVDALPIEGLPVLSNCSFAHNLLNGSEALVAGGAVGVMSDSPDADFLQVVETGWLADNCTFDSNAVLSGNQANFGGAITTGLHTVLTYGNFNTVRLRQAPVPHSITLTNCTFYFNGLEGMRASGGGALFSTLVNVSDTLFDSNYVLARHGGGGAIMTQMIAADRTNFTQNVAMPTVTDPGVSRISGGAVSTPSATTATDLGLAGCQLAQNVLPVYRHCFFDRNDAVVGGAIFATMANCGQAVDVLNCTAVNNTAAYGSFFFMIGTTAVSFVNSTFRQNKAMHAGTVFIEGSFGVVFNNMSFLGNEAPVAAALHVDSAASVLIMDSMFLLNKGTRGAIVRLTEIDRTISLLRSNFSYNIADAASGGALAINSLVATTNVLMQRCLFKGNSAVLGGALYVSLGIGQMTMANCTVRFNSANVGGGLLLMRSDVNVTGTEFSGNEAETNGGAIACDRGTQLVANNVSFTFEDASADGGALWLRESVAMLNGISFKSCSGGRGGAIASSEKSNVTMWDSNMYDCRSNVGGAFFGTSGSAVVMFRGGGTVNRASGPYDFSVAVQTVRAEDSVQYGGGFMSLDTGALAWLVNSTITKNLVRGGVGGAIRCSGCGTVVLEDVALIGNRVGAGLGGGAIFVDSFNGTSLALIRVFMRANNASGRSDDWRKLDSFTCGGGLFWRGDSSTFQLELSDLSVISNSADLGGGVFVDDTRNSSSPLNGTLDVQFTNNTAALVGGAVFVVSNVSAPLLEAVLNNASGNTAGCYGDNIGSGPSTLRFVSAPARTAMRGVPIGVHLEERDSFGRLTVCLARGGARTVLARVLNNDTCTLTAANVCSISDTRATCHGSVAVEAPVNSTCRIAIDLHVADILSEVVATAEMNVTLVSCAPGYGVGDEGHCHECPEGTYNTLESDGVCRPCPSTATCYHGASVSAHDGFWLWQTPDGEIQSFECEPGACAASPQGELNRCAGGRTGVLCASCANSTSGHYLAPVAIRANGLMCMPCDEPTWWIIVLLVVGGIALTLYLHHSVQGSSSRLKIWFFFTQSITQVLPRGSVNEFFSVISLRANRGSPVLLDSCVFPVGPLTMQIVQVAVPATLVVTLLTIYGSQRIWIYLRGPSLVENRSERADDADAAIDASAAGSDDDDGGESVRADEDVPAPISGGVGLSVRRSSSNNSLKSSIVLPGSMGNSSFFSIDRLVRSLIFFTLLSYTTLLQTALSILWCREVGDEHVLVTEPSEQCSGEKYERARAAALFGMLPVIVLLPLALGLLLFVWNRRNKLILSRSAERVADVDVRFGVLYENYKHKAYAWEVFILLRRLAMALLTIFLSGTPVLALAMTLLCLFVLALTWGVRPFVNEFENRLELTSLMALLVLSICTMAIYAGALPSGSASVLGVLALVIAILLGLTVVVRQRNLDQLKQLWAWWRAKAANKKSVINDR